MNGHKVELLAGAGAVTGPEEINLAFQRLTSNKMGSILKSSTVRDLNCMKLAHYLPVYEELFSCIGQGVVKMLEIGVQHGGSYRLWSNYFSVDLLQWTGVDIAESCEKMNHRHPESKAKVFIGSQDNAQFLARVAAARGPFDIIIDDGSHQSDHIIASFQFLSKHVKPGGIYIIEDVHACYWDGFRGTDGKTNALTYFSSLLHSLNAYATSHPRSSKSLILAEHIVPPAPIRRIDFLPSMIVVHIGPADPLIEWKSGGASIQSS